MKRRKKSIDGLKAVCWIILPIAVITLLILDASGVYAFTAERLLVLGVGLLIILLPFFSEISFKNVSVKREKKKER